MAQTVFQILLPESWRRRDCVLDQEEFDTRAQVHWLLRGAEGSWCPCVAVTPLVLFLLSKGCAFVSLDSVHLRLALASSFLCANHVPPVPGLCCLCLGAACLFCCLRLIASVLICQFCIQPSLHLLLYISKHQLRVAIFGSFHSSPCTSCILIALLSPVTRTLPGSLNDSLSLQTFCKFM